MATLTDILIASTSDAAAICADLRHHERWPCLQLRDLTPLVLADLLEALGEDDDAKALRAIPVVHHDKNGSWICYLPETLPIRLAALEDENLSGVATRWAEGEELSFDLNFQIRLNQPVDDYIDAIEQALRQLRDFSRKAVSANKPLLLWMSI